MEGKIRIRLATPDRVVAEGLYDRAVIPGEAGTFAVLDRRAPIISSISMGMLTLTAGGRDESYFVEDGVARCDGNVCLIAADDARTREGTDRTQVAWRLSELQKELQEAPGDQAKADIVRRIAYAQFVLEKLEED